MRASNSASADPRLSGLAIVAGSAGSPVSSASRAGSDTVIENKNRWRGEGGKCALKNLLFRRPPQHVAQSVVSENVVVHQRRAGVQPNQVVAHQTDGFVQLFGLFGQPFRDGQR